MKKAAGGVYHKKTRQMAKKKAAREEHRKAKPPEPVRVAEVPFVHVRCIVKQEGKVTMNSEMGMYVCKPATVSQLEYIKQLCQRAGYDPDEYNLDNMSCAEASDLINELMREV